MCKDWLPLHVAIGFLLSLSTGCGWCFLYGDKRIGGAAIDTVEPIRGKQMIQAMADTLRSYSERDYVLFLTGIYLGRRISDILPMRVKDVRGKDYVYFREGKKNKENTLKINKDLKAVFATYCHDKKDTDYLFPPLKGRKNKHITRQRYWQILNKASHELGFDEKIGCHSLRKTLGRYLYEQKVDISVIQMVLSHEDASYTKRYIGVTADEVNAVLSKVSFLR